eukprot:10991265-Prorocentrum_lima.AAC.1
MTSSLVGSEMCIRDRAGTDVLRHCETTRRLQRIYRALGMLPQGVPYEQAVSYTHLTLPTICSV